MNIKFVTISYGNDQQNFAIDDSHRHVEAVEVRDISKALLRDGVTLNNIHSLIEMGLDYDVDGVYDVTLALHGVSSFNQECNRISETSGLYPFMTMAVSNAFTLCHVYEMAMKTSAHNMQLQQLQHATIATTPECREKNVYVMLLYHHVNRSSNSSANNN